MHEFEYLAPTTLAEAIRATARPAGSVGLLAGGTDLIVGMRSGRRRPALVVDVKKVPELGGIMIDDHRIEIGAAVSCRRVYGHAAVSDHLPALVESARRVGGMQIQGRATLGGNLCNAAPSADVVPSLMVYSATALVAGERGTRRLPVEDFCIAPGQTCLAEGELLVALSLPRPAAHSGAAFLRFTPRNEMDIAVVNVAAFVQLDEQRQRFESVRVALGAVAPVPLLVNEVSAALHGRLADARHVDEAARLCEDRARPIDDMRGTIEHRRRLVRVLVTRALHTAIERAHGRCG